MSAVFLRLRAEARLRWRSWATVALLAGLLGGAATTALAGARRTETAYLRFVEGTQAFDVMVTNGGTTPDNLNRQFDFDELARLPQVADAAIFQYYFPEGTSPSGQRLVAQHISPFASPDGRFGSDHNRLHVLEGRLPIARDELAATFLAADNLDLSVGDTLHLRLAGPQALADQAGGAMEAFRVVGVVAMAGGFSPQTGGLPPPVILSPQYARAHPDAAQVASFRLRDGRAGIAAFERELDRRAGGEQVVAVNELEQTSLVQRGLSVQATALRALGVLVGFLAVLLVGLSLVRLASLGSTDDRVLRALGASPAHLRALAIGRSLVVAMAAGALAGVTAVALSPLTPVGVARRAELSPGVEVNRAYVAGGAGSVIFAVVTLGGLAAWLASRPRRSAGRAGPGASRWVASAARAGLPPPAVSGVGMALEPGWGRTAVPVRSTLLTVVLAVGTIAGVVTFAASLGHLFGEPRLYGWDWDVQVGDAFSPPLDGGAATLDRHPAVEALAIGTVVRLEIGSLRVDTLATQAARGRMELTVVEGRAPREPGEILVGTRTLRDLGADLGDDLTVGFGDRSAVMRVVGRGLLPEFAGAARLGEGAAVTLEGMRVVAPGTEADVVLVRFRPGSDRRAMLEEIAAMTPANLYLPSKPSDLADLERVGGLPSVVAGLLALMAGAMLAHTLVTSVRRRRCDLATLKALGFVRPQVSAAVAWQASTVAALAVVVGVPVGTAGGRWAWHVFAGGLGVPPRPVTPVLALALLALATILLANLVAALPARLAARMTPAATLRTE